MALCANKISCLRIASNKMQGQLHFGVVGHHTDFLLGQKITLVANFTPFL